MGQTGTKFVPGGDQSNPMPAQSEEFKNHQMMMEEQNLPVEEMENDVV